MKIQKGNYGLIKLLIAVCVVGILVMIALPAFAEEKKPPGYYAAMAQANCSIANLALSVAANVGGTNAEAYNIAMNGYREKGALLWAFGLPDYPPEEFNRRYNEMAMGLIGMIARDEADWDKIRGVAETCIQEGI